METSVLLSSPPAMLTPAEVAQRLGVSPRTLERWRANGVGPAWVRVGPRLVRYFAEGEPGESRLISVEP